MRITNVEPILLRGERAYAATAGGEEAVDNGDWQLLVKVSTDEGLVGWSDVETLAAAALACINGPGMSILGFRALKDLLDRRGSAPIRSACGTSCTSARATTAAAAWPCTASRPSTIACGRSAPRRRASRWASCSAAATATGSSAYASTLFRETPEAMAEAARGYVERGFRAVKFGWGVFGEDPARDVELVAAAREALGPDRELMIDPGWYGAGWKGPWQPRTLEDNVACASGLAPYRVRWIEDFIHPGAV